MSMPRIRAATSSASSGRAGQLHAAGLAAAADEDLGLDHDACRPRRRGIARPRLVPRPGCGRRPTVGRGARLRRGAGLGVGFLDLHGRLLGGSMPAGGWAGRGGERPRGWIDAGLAGAWVDGTAPPGPRRGRAGDTASPSCRRGVDAPRSSRPPIAGRAPMAGTSAPCRTPEDPVAGGSGAYNAGTAGSSPSGDMGTAAAPRLARRGATDRRQPQCAPARRRVSRCVTCSTAVAKGCWRGPSTASRASRSGPSSCSTCWTSGWSAQTRASTTRS